MHPHRLYVKIRNVFRSCLVCKRRVVDSTQQKINMVENSSTENNNLPNLASVVFQKCFIKLQVKEFNLTTLPSKV